MSLIPPPFFPYDKKAFVLLVAFSLLFMFFIAQHKLLFTGKVKGKQNRQLQKAEQGE
jgi:hypothetical protein